MFFVFVYFSCLWLMVYMLSSYHKNDTNLYNVIGNKINNNLYVFKYGIFYKYNKDDEINKNEIINYIVHKYNLPNFLNNTENYVVKDGISLYHDDNMIVFYKADEIINYINTTTDNINTWEWINDMSQVNTLSNSNKIIVYNSKNIDSQSYNIIN